MDLKQRWFCVGLEVELEGALWVLGGDDSSMVVLGWC